MSEKGETMVGVKEAPQTSAVLGSSGTSSVFMKGQPLSITL